MKINWNKELSNETVREVYISLVEGRIGRTTAETIFKYTPYAGTFRSLVRDGGIQRARTIARKALLRRNLVEV